MNTSQSHSTLAKPVGDEAVSLGALGYFRARNRNRAHDLVLTEFERSGISKATLARRMRKRPEVISRLLSGPGNWTMDTWSDLLFAISGGEAEYTMSYPLDMPLRNDTQPHWLTEDGLAQSKPRHQGSLSDSEEIEHLLGHRDTNQKQTGLLEGLGAP